jgi:hypothetical protein
MSRRTELIDEIAQEKKSIVELTEQLQEHFHILGGHFMSAKMLVPDNQWQEWLSANCDINHEAADVIMAGEYNPPDINRIMLTNSQSPMLGFNGKSESSSSNGRTRQKSGSKSKN